MAFEFKVEETVAKGIRRMARNQITRALDGLDGQGNAEWEEVVHSTRKRLKRVRTLIRLAREGLGRKCADREHDRLRDAARPLSEVRDAGVLVDTLDGLIVKFGDSGRPDALAIVREALVEHKHAVCRRVLDDGDALAKVARVLEDARRDVKNWEVAGDDWDILGWGLERMYRRGIRAFHEAAEKPTDENLHEWRKRAKDLGYVMDMFKPVRPTYTRSRADAAHKLADGLGEDHDLGVLRQTLSGLQSGSVDSASVAVILPLIEDRRAELQKDLLATGPILYDERPKVFVARMRAYWRAWRAEGEAARFDPR